MENIIHERTLPDRLAYSVQDASFATGLGRTTLYALMERGALPFCKIGKRRLIRRVDLDGLMAPSPVKKMPTDADVSSEEGQS